MSTRGRDFKPATYYLLVAVTAFAVMIVSGLIFTTAKWRDAAVFTTLLFTSVALVLRPIWSVRFYCDLALLLIAHSIILMILVPMYPSTVTGLPHYLMLPTGIVEGVLIASLLWARSAAARQDPHD
jgi:hypothetical protein